MIQVCILYCVLSIFKVLSTGLFFNGKDFLFIPNKFKAKSVILVSFLANPGKVCQQHEDSYRYGLCMVSLYQDQDQ